MPGNLKVKRRSCLSGGVFKREGAEESAKYAEEEKEEVE
jgi:hypothetical protein